MPLQSLKLSSSQTLDLKEQIRWMLNKQLLQLPKNADSNYDLGFCMHIQNVPRKEYEFLNFGKPEGIRAFIQSGTNVIAAADFLFTGNKMKMSYVHQGNALRLLLIVLNKLEKKYARSRKIYNAEFIYFLLSPGLYILIKSGKTKQFYYSTPKRLVPVSGDALKKQINKIIAQQSDTKNDNF
jgi:hypothetical protein